MSTQGSKLGRKQEAAIAALLVEPTHQAAARRCGIALSTLQRWLLVPSFQSAYRQARRAGLEATIARVQQSSSQALDTLLAALACDNPAVRVRAAQLILDTAFRGLETFDVVDRLEELEALLKELTHDDPRQPDRQAADPGPRTCRPEPPENDDPQPQGDDGGTGA